MFFEALSAHFWGSFMTWGFLIAFLFNVFGKVVGFKDSYSIIISALVVFMSYFISDHIFEFDTTTRVYLQWMAQDIFTIATIFLVHKLFKIKLHRASYYVYLGLSLNGLMFYLMWVDIQVLANQEPWWFWTLYSFGVNIVDYVMVITLIVGRDWLGLVRLARFIRDKVIAKKEGFIETQKEKRLSQVILQA
ncbi:hypothetical protein [Pseudoalteromonas spongiae]|uniref:hypothetical protein n=1 Tax=Pseudoalteromonas spongiae TaxID=298657 RepID=UPI00026CB3C0|nr:hypothetical protein [Pseudoalteromonas spongiae]ATC97910.1 hypothetical protein PSPO_a0725 [Pseudoalteromonas spongiae UST010723-006]